MLAFPLSILTPLLYFHSEPSLGSIPCECLIVIAGASTGDSGPFPVTAAYVWPKGPGSSFHLCTSLSVLGFLAK